MGGIERKTPSFYDHSEGVWLDEFFDHWITKEIIQGHIENKKGNVCIVSPELHKRDYIYEWKTYKENFDIIFSKDVSLCTDKPKKRKIFSNEENKSSDFLIWTAS